MKNLMHGLFFYCFPLFVPGLLEATAQAHEILRINGVEMSIISNPLQPWAERNPGAIPSYGVTSTSRWRGYLGSWELRSNHLYLVDVFVLRRVEGVEDFETEDVSVMAVVFPSGEPVVADWYSGYLIVTEGELEEYIHMGYASKFSSYLVVEVESGRVVDEVAMTSNVFEDFRRKQFRNYQRTDDYRELLQSTVDHGTTEESAIEFIFESASVYYLSKRFEDSNQVE